MTEPKTAPSDAPENRRFKMPEPKRDGLSPAERLAEHRASKARRGPDPGTLRLRIRAELGGEKGAEAPLVRKLYDKTTRTKQKRRRRKGTP